MSPNKPLTNAQCDAVTALRTMYASSAALRPQNTAESVEERARSPDPKTSPADITIRIEIAPPSSQPHPLLVDTGVLKAPERVPVYFYALRDDSETTSDAATESNPAKTRVIFFIHGGGNVVGHPTHEPFLQFYARTLRAVASTSPTPKCVLIAPSYRLATIAENVFPAALQDLVAAYDYVLDKGYDASNIVIAGDSAGGNHGQYQYTLALRSTRGTDTTIAIVLAHLVLQSGRPPPRGIIAIAPSATRVSDHPSDHTEAQADKDILSVSAYRDMRKAYIGNSGVSHTDPLVSGAFIPFTTSWPRTLILVGTADHLIDASRELERRLKGLDRPVELVEYDERPHGWWVMEHVFPENIQDAVEIIAQFIHQ